MFTLYKAQEPLAIERYRVRSKTHSLSVYMGKITIKLSLGKVKILFTEQASSWVPDPRFVGRIRLRQIHNRKGIKCAAGLVFSLELVESTHVVRLNTFLGNSDREVFNISSVRNGS